MVKIVNIFITREDSWYYGFIFSSPVFVYLDVGAIFICSLWKIFLMQYDYGIRLSLNLCTEKCHINNCLTADGKIHCGKISKLLNIISYGMYLCHWIKSALLVAEQDLFTAMIQGPSRTPYEDGLFFFDVQLPSDYPNSPPIFFYISYCKERLNPNLYEDGKVCVSLLGTWTGKVCRHTTAPLIRSWLWRFINLFTYLHTYLLTYLLTCFLSFPFCFFFHVFFDVVNRILSANIFHKGSQRLNSFGPKLG